MAASIPDEILSLAERLYDHSDHLGVSSITPIKAEDIVVSDFPEYLCRSCPTYGRSFNCRPYTMSPDQTKRLLGDYDYAAIVQIAWEAGRDNNGIMKRLNSRSFTEGYYKSFPFYPDPCRLCSPCVAESIDGIGALVDFAIETHTPIDGDFLRDVAPILCKRSSVGDFPNPMPESTGIDMFATVRRYGYEIETLKSREDVAPYVYSILLID